MRTRSRSVRDRPARTWTRSTRASIPVVASRTGLACVTVAVQRTNLRFWGVGEAMAVGVAVASATLIAVGEGLARGGCALVDVIVARR